MQGNANEIAAGIRIISLKQLFTVAFFDYRFGLYLVAVVLVFYAVRSALQLFELLIFLAD